MPTTIFLSHVVFDGDSVRAVITDKPKNRNARPPPTSSSSHFPSEMIKRVLAAKMTPVTILLTLGLFGVACANPDLQVTLRQGTLLGVEKINRLTKEPYYAFLGIPYAKPPVREKRFKDPEDPLPWNGLLNATQEGSSCVTYNVIFKYSDGDEDCLHLNIYSSKKPKDLLESPLPVMVWIHGGAFMSGSGRPSDYGPDFLIQQDILLVSINYRLNVFGFLSVQNDLVPGNAGLKDQVKALKWIKENIAAFGGDPNSVTIFGESAGGASVHYLLLSPSARVLFHRAISQSGVSINPWASTQDIKNTAFKLGEVFDCNTQNSYELVDCLQQVKAKDLVAYQFNILSLKSIDIFTKNLNLPCIEPENTKNGFLTKPPIEIIKEGSFTDVPFLLGAVKFETLLLEKLFSDVIPESIRKLILDQVNAKPELLLPRNLAFDTTERAKEAGRKMKEFYFQNEKISNETVDNLINATTDSWFLYGIHETARLHAKNGKSPVYYYNFVLETEFAESEKMVQKTKPGPSHADDLKYFFYMWDKDIEISSDEMEKIWQVNTLWTNFAKYGDPTPDTNVSEVIWEPFTYEKESYLEIGDNLTMKIDLEKERMQFWQNITLEDQLLTY